MTRLRKRTLRTHALALLLAALVAAAGCANARPPRPPQEAPVSPVVPPAATQTVAIFFPDWQAQHMIPEPRQLPEASGAELANLVVRAILAGPQEPHLRRAMPEGVRLLEPVAVRDGVAYVNLSPEVQKAAGSAGAFAVLNSLRLSLTEIAGISRVHMQIDGRTDIDFAGLMIDEPMTRGLYLYPVFVNPERVAYLQGRYDQGLDEWRGDPLKVAQWEGRMFGFTAAELQAATVSQNGSKAGVQVAHSGDIYTIRLTRNAPAQGQGIWSIAGMDPLVRHSVSALPEPVRAWVDCHASTTIGVTREDGDRTYLLAAVEVGAVRIADTRVENGELIVLVTEQGPGRVDVTSVIGEQAHLPATFRWLTEPTGPVRNVTAPDALPVLRNPNKLPEAKLTGDIAVLSPTPEQSVTGSIAIKGYARHLFEANLVARLLDQQGREVARNFTTAGACCFDWGSFDFQVTHRAPAGRYRLELGDFSARDGTWQATLAIPVNVAR